MYDSKAMTLSQWNIDKNKFRGWEYNIVGNVVYLRKHISGNINIESQGWKENS